MLKLQSPSRYCPLDAIHLLRCFVHRSEQFWTHWFGCLLLLLLFLVSPLPHQQKRFPLRTFFIWRKPPKKVTWCKIRWMGREGHGVILFWVKNCQTFSAMWEGVLVNHTSWNEQICWKNLWKNSLKLNAAPHNNASWYTDTDGFLRHSPNGGSLYKGHTLQKIISVFGGWVPFHLCQHSLMYAYI